jgi:ATP-dependent Lhr-like helicase
MIKDMTVYVRAAKGKALVPSYLGGRLPLSSIWDIFKRKIIPCLNPKASEKELKFLHPLLVNQENNSHIPKKMNFWWK